MKAFKISTHGDLNLIQLPEREQLFMSMREAINCDYIGIINSPLPELNNEYCIVYDDEALLHGTPQVNVFASILYGVREHNQPICGDVLIMRNHYNEDGELETVGMSRSDCNRIVAVIWETITR